MIPDTSKSLLHKLCRSTRDDVWQQAWGRFVALYGPVMTLWARRAGLDAAAADLLVQDVFSHLVEKIKLYHHEKGKFRHWLRTVAMNQLRALKRRAANTPGPLPDELRADPRLPDPAEAFWEGEIRDHLMRRALAIMQKHHNEASWQGFLAFFLDGKPAAQIAAEQGRSAESVIASNYRILSRLKDEFGEMWE
jgi:RNA polymerase sigma-70 factor (ECF subfamily)